MAEELVARAEKACTRCHIVKPANEFCRGTPRKGGGLSLQSRCRECQRELVREWRVKNKAKISVKMKEVYWSDPDAFRKKVLDRYHADIEVGRARVAKSYQKHRKKRRAAADAYKAANIEKIRQRRREYYHLKIKTDPAKKLRLRMQTRFKLSLSKSLRMVKIDRNFEQFFGYTPAKLAAHIISKFQPGMTVNDLLAGKIHIDHIRPISSFNITSLDCPELKACWALDNLQPLWAKDNLSKGARLTWSPVHAEAIAGDPAHPG